MSRIERALAGLLGALARQAVVTVQPAVAQPAPPVLPPPVVDYEYDAKGNLTKATQAKGVTGFGFSTTESYDRLERRKDSTDPKIKDKMKNLECGP